MFGRRIVIIIITILVLAGALAWAIGAFKSEPTSPSAKTPEGIDLRDTAKGPAEITISDNGKAFSYAVGSRFTVILDSTLYPENALSCAPPSGVVRVVEKTKDVRAPLYARTFEVVKEGVCTMTDTTFIAAIVVTE